MPDSQPALPPPGPPPPANFQSLIPAGQLSFLSGFANQPANTLLKDKRFRGLMKAAIPHTEYHYGRDMPLDDAVSAVLDGSMLPVQVRNNRFVTVAGSQGRYLGGRKPASRSAPSTSSPPTANPRPASLSFPTS
jgi:hypothetical protein